MAYPDIEVGATAWKTDGQGDFELENREVGIAADVLLTNLGGFKYAPLVGGRAEIFLNSTQRNAAVIQRTFKVALKTAGFQKPIVDVSDFPNEIRVNDDIVLE